MVPHAAGIPTERSRTLGAMEFMGPALLSGMMIPLMIIGSVPLFIYIYALIRWRAGGEEEPGLGSYALVLAFRMIAVLLGVSAIAMMLYIVLSDEDHEEVKRVVNAVFVSAALFLGIQFALAAPLRPGGRFRPARRLFGGGVVGIAGLLTLAAMLASLIVIFQDPETERQIEQHRDMLKAFGSWLVCFGALYVGSSFWMARDVGARA